MVLAGLTVSAKTPVYKDAKSPVEARVADLLGRMTVDEKIGQLNQRFIPEDEWGRSTHFPALKAGEIGSVMSGGFNPEWTNELQKIAVEQTRLGIPLLIGRDVIHGYRTIFPIPLGQAAMFDPEAVEHGARIAAEEATADGIRWTFAPMIDISRDARWGRIAESCGEDPYLTSLLAEAMVRGFQNGDNLKEPSAMAACAKHFAGYGAVEGGRDYNLTGLTERELRQTYLPPFKRAKDAGVLTFMTSFNANDGIPSTCNRRLLTDILRDEWGFEGFVISDYAAIRELIAHRVAKDEAEATSLSFNAGVDMDMDDCFFIDNLPRLIADGKIPEKNLDAAVARVLRIKFLLGLFENPYVKENQSISYSPDHLEAAREAASKSVVMLKNDNATLPLDSKKYRKILLTGPMADAKHNQLGTWVFDGEDSHTRTILDAFKDNKDFEVVYSPGLPNPRSLDSAPIEDAIAKAADVDAIVAVIGEDAILSGEAHSMAEIEPVGAQSELIERLKATGKPLITIVMAGRPLAIGKELELSDALLFSFHPGTMGGPAILDLLTGKESPSGRLPVTFPSTSGQCPIYYNHPSTGRPATGTEMRVADFPDDMSNTTLGSTSYYLDAGSAPLFPFGYGLTYGTFGYSDLQLDKTEFQHDEVIRASFTLTNNGGREATEGVQLYTADLVASVTPSIADLRAFRRVTLKPGETRRVELTFPVSALAIVGQDLVTRVEPGEFSLRIAPDSAAEGLETIFTVK